MASLSTAVNQIVGGPTDTTGIRYYCNYSTTSAPGASAPNQLTIKLRAESIPPVFSDDPTADFPGVYFERLQWPMVDGISGLQYDVSFFCRIYYVAAAAVGERPKEEANEMIIKVIENIMGSDTLGLTWITTVDWQGVEDRTEISQAISILLPDYYAASSVLRVRAEVAF